MSEIFCECDGCLNGEPCIEVIEPADRQAWLDFVLAATDDDFVLPAEAS